MSKLLNKKMAQPQRIMTRLILIPRQLINQKYQINSRKIRKIR